MLFDDVEDWKKWKSDPFNVLEKKYGKEFADWAKENNNKVPKYLVNSGCKTSKEYLDKCAQKIGFKDWNRRKQEWRYETGRASSKRDNPDCSLWFGEFISQEYVMKTFEDPIQMPPGNPGFDWICKGGEKIDHKGACIQYPKNQSQRWLFNIRYNNIANYFILSAWDDRDSLTPLHIWIFHKNDTVRGKKFWRRDVFVIINNPEGLKEFENYEVTDRLDKLKKLCNKKI